MKKSKFKIISAFFASAIVACVFAGCSIFNFGTTNFPSRDFSNVQISFDGAVEIPNNANWMDIAEATLPSAVNIKVHEVGSTSANTGSGICIAPNSIIATNYHVISSYVLNPDSTFNITYSVNGDYITEYQARVLWWSASTDVALIQALEMPNNEELPFVKIMDRSIACDEEDELRICEPVITIGTPIDASLQNTVTMGIISQTNRFSVSSENFYEDLIQHDASISPGSSGGALIDSNGCVVGLNTLGRLDEDASGLFYAVPVTPIVWVLPNVLEALLENELFETPKFGISVTDKYMGGTFTDDGLLISEVFAVGSLSGKVQAGQVLKGMIINDVTYPINKRNDLAYVSTLLKKGDSAKAIVSQGTGAFENTTEISFTVTVVGN